MNMRRENCDRCSQPTNGTTIMSMFNEDVICMSCKDAERNHTDYKKASDTELQQVQNGNMNFEGIGKPTDL